MTWQRIDENTYIDNTLVTCAEYQLFIEEMRKRGNFHQPDQWISYHFPEGQAHASVSGMRYSDALSFCIWVTEHEANEWSYRLPKDIDAKTYLLKPEKPLASFGYWTVGPEDQLSFAWINPTIPKRRGVDFELVIKDFTPDFTLDLKLKDAISRAHNRPVDIEGKRLFSFFTEFTKEISKKVTTDITLDNVYKIYEIINEITIAIDRGYNRHRRRRHPPHDYFHARVLSLDLNKACASALELATGFEPLNAIALDLFIDLLTLQERIAGRSPAFEGIRLVKERIR